jgi:hypothetical protein
MPAVVAINQNNNFESGTRWLALRLLLETTNIQAQTFIAHCLALGHFGSITCMMSKATQ